jgi:molecular chaperone DnaK (HSP70)
MSLGIEVSGKKMSVIIPRGTIIPAKLTQIYTTLEDYQIAVTLRVFEGENSYTRDNKRLGEFDLNGIEVALKHVPKIHVTFDIDNNNMLSVTAIDSKTGRSKSVTIKRDNGELDVEKIIQENLKNADKDKAVKDKYEARLLLE